MNVLVIGSGGREHAIVKKVKESPLVTELYALPGNAGMAGEAITVPHIAATDINGIVEFCKDKSIDYVIVTPDDPLALGAVDALQRENIPCFGPTKAAARIESSKVYAKHLMKKHNIPTAAYEVFEDVNQAVSYLKTAPYPTVIKADGLALGKGVIIAQNYDEAYEAVTSMMQGNAFGASGKRVVIEEFLQGEEVSILAFCDGETIVPMVSSMDHKRAQDFDQGLNTGGMGTIAPNPFYTKVVEEQAMNEILLPTVKALRQEGTPFAGCLYFGLMITKEGPKVIEYNARFGDPETQAVLALLESDLLSIMQHVTKGTLKEADVRFSRQSACCLVLCSKGYPQAYEKGHPITIEAPLPHGAEVYFAGVAAKEETLVTSGGRVLGVVCRADTLQEAVNNAYDAANNITFENKYFRTDIGRRALTKQS